VQPLIARSSAPAAIVRPSKLSPETLVWTSTQLTVLAEARQAAITSETLRLYASQLARFQPDDIAAGIQSMMLTKRREGETAFPDLATVMDAVNAAIRNRQSRTTGEVGRKEVEEFDAFLAERIADGEGRDAILKRFPSMANAWRAWKGL
jgi:hypothetical protein